MAKSRARFLAELLGSDGLVKTTTSSLAGADGIIDLGVLPSIPNSKLSNSSITINSSATSLGGSITLTSANLAENTNLYYTNARADARITNAGSGNWNTAYGWGNHASGGYAPLSSPTLTGTPAAPTASGSTSTTQVATTAFVQQELTTLIGGAPSTLNDLNELAAAINDDANYNSTLTTALATKAPLASPTFTSNINVTGSSTLGSTASPLRTLDSRGSGMAIFGTGSYTEIMLRERGGTLRNTGAWHWSVRGDVGGANDDLKLLRFTGGSYQGVAMQIASSTGNATFSGNTTFSGSVTNTNTTGLGIQTSGYSLLSAANNARAASGSLRLGNGGGSTGLVIDYTDQGQTVATIRNVYVASDSSELTIQSPFITFDTGTSYTEALKLDHNQNATFTGNIILDGTQDQTLSTTTHSLLIKNAGATGAGGLVLQGSSGTHGLQMYWDTDGANYGFLDAAWANWDIKKARNGAFHVDEGSGLKRVLNEANWSSYITVGDGGLTTKNFTTALKTKLDGITASANNYVLPFTNNSSNWNTAYGWGNHASGGYRSSTGNFEHIGRATTTNYNNNSGSWGARLQVSDSVHSKINVSQEANGMISHWYAHTGHTAIKFGTESSHGIDFQTAGVIRMQVAATGYILIKSHTNGWDGGLRMVSSDGSDTFKIHPDDNGYMYADKTWNFSAAPHVGIGNPVWHTGTLTTTNKSNYDTAVTVANAALPKAGGTLTGTLTTGGNIVVPSDTGLQTAGTHTRFTTANGYIQLGPMNTSYAHIYTDRGSFYFNKNTLYANGNTMWTAGNDGAGSGLDADLLDGQQGSYYAPAGVTIANAHQAHAVTGNAFASSASGAPSSVLEYQQASGQTDTRLAPSGDWHNTIRMGHGNPYNYYSNTIAARMTGTGYGDLYTQSIYNNTANGWRKLWSSGNDGSGSGLDADLLDGQQLSYVMNYDNLSNKPTNIANAGTLDGLDSLQFLRSDADDTASGQYTFSKVNDHAIRVGTIRGTVVGSRSGEYIQMYNRVHIGSPSGWGSRDAPTYGLSTYGGVDLATDTGGVTISGSTAWHAGNDGSGSGLDADLLDGLDSGAFARLGGTNHLRSIPNRWFATADADNNIDYYTHAYAKAHMGNTYNYTTSRPAITSDANYWVGTMGWAAIDLDTIFGYGSGDIDAWGGPANQPSGTTHWVGSQHLHYHNGSTGYGTQRLTGAGNPALTYIRGIWGGSFTSWYKDWNTANDGSGSGLDADLLDGQQGSYYYSPANPSPDTNTTYNFGGSTFTSRNSGNVIAIDSVVENMVGYVNTSTAAGYSDGAGFSAAYSSAWVGQLFVDFRTGKLSTRGKNSGTWQAHRFMWDNLNDGSGSGLDADLLDGGQGSEYARQGNVGYQQASDLFTFPSYNDGNSASGDQASLQVYNGNASKDAFMQFHVSGDYAAYFGLDGATNDLFIGGWSAGNNKHRIWHAGNDGTGTGLDADLLDGQEGSWYLGKNVNTMTASGFKLGFHSGAGGTSFGANHYSMGVDYANGGWSGPNYSDLIIGYHTGIRIGAAYGGTKFYNNSPTTDANNNGEGDGGETLLMTVGGVNGGTGVKVNNFLTAGQLRINAAANSLWFAGTDSNWRIGRSIVADTGCMITGDAIQLLTGGNGTTYGFQILGHQTNTNPCFEVAPGANPSLSATRIVGRLQVGEDEVTGDGITIHSYYGNGGGFLRFDSGYIGANHQWEMACINVTDDGNFNGRIEFRTAVVGRNTPTVKMTVKANGDIIIPGTLKPVTLTVSGTSTLDEVYAANSYVSSWFRNSSASAGMYNQALGAHWYADAAGTWNMGGGGGSAYLRMRTTHASTNIGTMHANTSYQHGFLNTSDGWKFFADNSNNLYCYGNVTAYYSDGRLKDEQTQLETGAGLALINQLKVKSFVWNALTEDNPAIETGTTEIGLIAQEVEPFIPNAVVINEASNPSSAQIEQAEEDGLPVPEMPDYKTINYDKLIPFLVQAVQDLSAEVKELKQELRRK